MSKPTPQAAAKPHAARGVKRPHRTLPIETRFWNKVNKRGPDDCWNWTAGTDRGGYGAFWDGTHLPGGNPRMATAHRWLYQQEHGPLARDVMVCHRCDNRRCVNPSHMFLGSGADNTRDMVKKGRNVRGGYKHGMAKLTASAVLEIRDRRATRGATYSALAAEFGVSDSLIGAVVTRKVWKHVA